MLEHGGKLDDAIKRYGRKREDWLDLSTGINPCPYPVPALSPGVWHRLPEASEAFLRAAQEYYGVNQLLAVAGSQAAIQGLPRLRKSSNVLIAAPSYAEHAHGWQQAGHRVREVAYGQLDAAVASSERVCDVVVICNPNNPTGERIAPERLLAWADTLAQRGGWLIVDEAFCDMTPMLSVITSAAAVSRSGLIVLRSVGKFFGLAGLRLGFVAAEEKLLASLADFLGPWTVSTATQEIATAALSDTRWQTEAWQQLDEQGKRLHDLLAEHTIDGSGCALFQYWASASKVNAARLAEHMAQHGIWIRLFAHGVRLGLPSHEDGWRRLRHALQTWKNSEDEK